MARGSQDDLSLIDSQGRARIAELLQLPTQFIKSVEELATTHSLILEQRGIGNYEALEIGEALRAGSMPDLEWLRLSHNFIKDLGLEAIILVITAFYEDVIRHFKSTVPAYLHKNPVNENEGLDCLARLGSKGLFFLLHLDVSFNMIQSSGALSVAEAIRKGLFTHLLNLYLDNNRIGVEGIEALSKSLQSNNLPRLERLRLANNAVRDEGAVALSSALMAGHLPSLLELDLSSNGIGERGAVTIASALKDGNLPRQHLDLRANRIGKNGAKSFLDAFQKNCSLETLVELEWTCLQVQRRAGAYRLRNRRFNRRFQELEYVEKAAVSRGRIILCGNEEVGRTDLRKSLEVGEANIVVSVLRSISSEFANLSSIFQREQPTITGGVTSCYLETITEKREMAERQVTSRLKLWDLAGRPELHMLHSQFLRDSVTLKIKTTTFVVVCRGDTNEAADSEEELQENDPYRAQEELFFWLRFIATGAVGETKRNVIIVLNRYKGDASELERELEGRRWLDSHLILQLQAQFEESLQIHEHPFIVDSRSPESVTKLRHHIEEHTNNQLPGRQRAGLKEPKVCDLLRDKVNRWTLKSLNKVRSPALNWEKLQANFKKGPRALRAAAEYLDEVGDIILFSEPGYEIDEECNSSKGLLVISSEWVLGTFVPKLLLPEEDLSISLRQRIHRNGFTTREEVLERLKAFSAADRHAKHLHVYDMLAVLMRLGVCYRAGPEHEKLFIPALTESGQEGQLLWWENVGAQWVLGRCYKLKESGTTALPWALFYRFQMDLPLHPAFGGRAESDYQASKTLITLKCLGMALLVEFIADERDSSKDRIDILVKPLVERRDAAHGRAWRGQQVNLIEFLFYSIQLQSVRCCPRVEFSHFILLSWPAARATVPMSERHTDFSLDDLKRLVFEGGSMKIGREPQLSGGSDNVVRDDELLSGEELAELRVLVDDQCSMGKQAIIELGLTPYSEDMEEERNNGVVGLRFEHQSSFSKSSGDHAAHYSDVRESDPHIVFAARDVKGEWSQDHRRVIEFAQIMPLLRTKLDRSFARRDHLLHHIWALEGCSVDEQEFSVPRFMYIEKFNATQAPDKKTTFTLQFLCENQHTGNGKDCHEHNQKGLTVELERSNARLWLRKAFPYLRWSLIVLHLQAEVGGAAVHEHLSVGYPPAPFQEEDRPAAHHIACRVEMLLKELTEYASLEESIDVPALLHEVGERNQTSRKLESFKVDEIQKELSHRLGETERSQTPVLPGDGSGVKFAKNLKVILLELLEELHGNVMATTITNLFGLHPAVPIIEPCDAIPGRTSTPSLAPSTIWICNKCDKKVQYKRVSRSA